MQIGDDRYRSLFATIDEGLCVLEVEYGGDGNIADLRFREVNEAFERQSGMREVLGKPLSRFLPDFARQRAGAIARVLETGGPLRLENFHADTGRWYRVQYSRIGGERSRLLAAVFEDVTERKFAERTANRLAAIVDSSDDAIISKDLDGSSRPGTRARSASSATARKRPSGARSRC
ncbi:MAG TPA: PAS domain S-box protein [Gammaproteobacteria bacterium]|nr:PAS domain S-box protein [Gammaproteobacteria bacterium]